MRREKPAGKTLEMAEKLERPGGRWGLGLGKENSGRKQVGKTSSKVGQEISEEKR